MSTPAEQAMNRLIWSAALRSGQFKQTKEKLGDLEQGMCCLGVGCHVLGVEYNPEDAFPPKEFCDKVGLLVLAEHDVEINGEFDGGSLVHLNDVDELSFPEISLVIETNPSLWEDSDFQQARVAAHEAELEDWARQDAEGLHFNGVRANMIIVDDPFEGFL